MASARHVYGLGKSKSKHFILNLKHISSPYFRVENIVCSNVRDITTTPFPEFKDANFKSHEQLHKFSVEHPDQFWATLARSRLQWFNDFDKTEGCDINRGHINWFLGGKLNAAGERTVIDVILFYIHAFNCLFTYKYACHSTFNL